MHLTMRWLRFSKLGKKKTTLSAYANRICSTSFLGLQNSVQIVFGPLECSINEIFELDSACAALCLCIEMVTVYEMEKICGRWSRADREKYRRLKLFHIARWMCFLLQYTTQCTHMHLYAGLYVAVETLNKVSNLNSSHVPLNYIINASLCVCRQGCQLCDCVSCHVCIACGRRLNLFGPKYIAYEQRCQKWNFKMFFFFCLSVK